MLRPATLLAIVLVLAPLGAADVQEGRPTTLSFGEASAPPGSPVVAPLMLSAPDELRVGAVTVRVKYPKALLEFDKIEPSGLALSVDAFVQSEVKAGPDEASTTLEIRISAKRALPSGPLAYVSFRIGKGAEPETSIALAHVAEAMSGTPPRAVEPVVAEPAAIRVAAPAVPACFFYMH